MGCSVFTDLSFPTLRTLRDRYVWLYSFDTFCGICAYQHSLKIDNVFMKM